jgi:tetratricopeptide (TPR) repeat protein
MRSAKKKVLMIHPDKSRLPSNYFLFYKQAYEIVLNIYKQKSKFNGDSKGAPQQYTPDVEQHASLGNNGAPQVDANISKKFSNSKFNELYDQNMVKKADTSRFDWFKRDEPEIDDFSKRQVNPKNMGSELEAIKQKLMGNGGDALKYFEQCVGINPESDASYYQMAQIVIINGDLKNGKSYALKAHSIDSTNIWYLMILAGIYYQEKNIDSAIVCYENAVKSYPEKENLKLALGNLYSENKSYEKANSVFRELDVAGSVNENIKLAAVKNLITAGRFSEALSKTKELLAINPEEIVYSGLLAEIYSALGEKDKALEVYKALMEKNPDNSQTQLSLCDFLITEKSYDELFNLLNTINFNSGITREEKISIYVRLLEIPSFVKERGDELIVTLMVLEATYKDDKVIPLLMPDLFIKQDRMQDASERLEEIVKVTPQNYYAWEKLLFIYLQMKDYKKLESRGEECASLFNTSFVVKILYANGAAENSQFEIALGELKKAEILAGENKEYIMQVLTMRADIYYRMKDYDKAFNLNYS